MYTCAKWNLHSAAIYAWQRRPFGSQIGGSWMTPKYSAQWWEKVTATPQSAERDAPPTTYSDSRLEMPQAKTKQRKASAPTRLDRGLAHAGDS
jgi:hypothetical protein